MKFLEVGIIFGIISTVLAVYDAPGRTTYFINGEFYVLNSEGDDMPSPTDFLNGNISPSIDPGSLPSIPLPISKSVMRLRNAKRKNNGKARLRSGLNGIPLNLKSDEADNSKLNDVPLNLKSDEVDNTIQVDEKNKATYRRMPDNDDDE
ncbi:uncharacterized protein [Onthophagus taurus]|uniref:uncharacterized protein n=1 Tax=Onthophagus taurus TaxID=166361 RepID=UPI0039BEC34F